MVITIRFIDWVLFFFVFFCWATDHWFTTYGLKTIATLYGVEFISHTIECFMMFLLLIALIYVVFKLYRRSIFLVVFAFSYMLFTVILSYFWNSFLMVDQSFRALAIAGISCIITIIGSFILCKLDIKFFFPLVLLVLWRLLLFIATVFCLKF